MAAGPENATYTTAYPPTKPSPIPCSVDSPDDNWVKNPNDPDSEMVPDDEYNVSGIYITLILMALLVDRNDGGWTLTDGIF